MHAVWTVLNTILLVASFRVNVCFILLFFADELGLALATAGYFLDADGSSAAATVKCISGACCFAAGILGFYYVTHLLCEDVLGFGLPVADTSQYFNRPGATSKEDA